MQTSVAAERQAPRVAGRVESVDVLRGVVMVIMALDHVRDFFHSQAASFSPEDLSRTYPILFFTRWITHFCAPVFVFLAGVSVDLSSFKRRGSGATSKHLMSRGAWLIALEWTVLEFMWTFDFRYELVVLQVIWVIGWSMIVLSGLIWLPRRVVAVAASAMIGLHNAFDGVRAESFGGAAWVWNILHQPNLLHAGKTDVFVLYPLVPWLGVMAAGYCFGSVFRLDEERRRKFLVRLGIGLTGCFLAIRAINIYGDPQAWSVQKTLALTALSFLRVSKYPPSLDYLLMTLGPAILALGLLDGIRLSDYHPVRVFGRVPMIYYLMHFYLIHFTAVVAGGLRYGRWDIFVHYPRKLLGLPDPAFPSDWGYHLAFVYCIWIAVVAVLYLPCRYFMGLKQRRRWALLSYF